MIYLEVRWIHNLSDEPELIVSELDNDRNEIRKVEIFKNNRKGYADKDNSVNGSCLSEIPIPIVEEINSDNQFMAKEISRERFEEIWNERHA